MGTSQAGWMCQHSDNVQVISPAMQPDAPRNELRWVHAVCTLINIINSSVRKERAEDLLSPNSADEQSGQLVSACRLNKAAVHGPQQPERFDGENPDRALGHEGFKYGRLQISCFLLRIRDLWSAGVFLKNRTVTKLLVLLLSLWGQSHHRAHSIAGEGRGPFWDTCCEWDNKTWQASWSHGELGMHWYMVLDAVQWDAGIRCALMSEGLFSYIHTYVITQTEMHSYLHSKFMEMLS